MSQKINKLGNIDTFLNDCIDYGILDEEQESKKIEYLVAKNYLKEFVDSLNSVSVSFKGSIVFENNNLNAEHLIYKINEVLQLKIKNSSLNIIELKKEKDDEEESMLISGGGSGKNSEYEKMVNFLNKKEEIIRFITVFVDLFNNTLNLTERKIIYYTFFKKETDNKITTCRIQYCTASLYLIRKQATIELVQNLLNENL
ncbi:hypothetical protein CUW_1918 [Turicibacter sanguinis PC909]|uniref:Uncharacterized protein n=1 Tax=Turicibacter sanguinis PC909 TaxID=702450 RepID=A0ABP2HXZ6_9FIRM|nr:hypothetical protein [Turicibacter sanguinis]EFF62512.1 hypothetical protein CUW_1918 [Turicibacter sanguinis PC909]